MTTPTHMHPHTPALRLAACPDCATVQRLPGDAGRWNLIACATCASPLERRNGRSRRFALAFAAAGAMLLLPANTLPFLGTAIAGISRESVLGSCATAMLGNGFPELALVIGLFVVVLPPLRLVLLSVVLGVLEFGRGARPAWLGPMFRVVCALADWAMADVFLLGFAVAAARLATSISLQIGLGAWCFVAAGILTLLTRATLDVPAVWRAIGPDASPARIDSAAPPIACGACALLLPAPADGTTCPRCRARVHARKPNATMRAAALTLAAALLYIPSNLYPMATLPIGFDSEQYTVLQGVIDLFMAGLWGLGVLVFVASFAIPLAKLAGLAWFIATALRGSGRRLGMQSRLYAVVAEIGRWSMVDVFVIACFVPVTQYQPLVHGRAEPAAPMFAAVVILTMLASHAFDPRAMWDASRSTKVQP